jgi:hypothetical protein
MIALLNQIPSETQIKKCLKNSIWKKRILLLLQKQEECRSEDRYRCRKYLGEKIY